MKIFEQTSIANVITQHGAMMISMHNKEIPFPFGKEFYKAVEENSSCLPATHPMKI